MFISQSFLLGLSFLLIALVPSSDVSASLFKDPKKLLDLQSVEKIWSHVDSFDAAAGNPPHRKAPKKQRTRGSSGGKHQEKKRPDVRWVKGKVNGQGYIFEIDEAGYVRAFDGPSQKWHYDPRSLELLNFDSLEWAQVSRQLSGPLRAARRKRAARAPSRKKKQRRGGGAKKIASATTATKPASHRTTKRQVAKGASGKTVDDDATRTRVRKAELDEEIAVLADSLKHGAPVLEREPIPPLKRLPLDPMRKVRQMLDLPDGLNLSWVSKHFQTLHVQEQKVIREAIEKNYNTLRELDPLLAKVDGNELITRQQQHRETLRTLTEAVEKNLRAYGKMDDVEKEALFYVANALQLEGRAEKALKVFNAKEVTLDKLKTYDVEHAEVVLMTYVRAGKHIEVADAVRAGHTENILGANVFSMLGDIESGAGASYLANMVERVREATQTLGQGVDVERVQKFTDKWIEVFALQGRKLTASDTAFTYWQNVLSSFNQQGYIRRFLESKNIPARSKAMLGVSLRESEIVLPPHEGYDPLRAALRYLEQLNKENDEFAQGLYTLATLGGQERRALVLAYEMLYNDPVGIPWRREELQHIFDSAENNAMRVFLDEGRVVGAEEAVGAAEAVGAPGAGGAEHLIELDVWRHLSLARTSKVARKPDETLKHAQYVLDLEHDAARLPGAISMAHSYKVASTVDRAFGAFRKGSGSKELEEATRSFQDAVRQDVPINLGAASQYYKAIANRSLRRSEVDAMVGLLWNSNRFEFLDHLVNRKLDKTANGTRDLDIFMKGVLRSIQRGKTKVTPKAHEALKELAQYRDPEHVLDLAKIPKEYRADALYQRAVQRMNKNEPGNDAWLIAYLERILDMNPREPLLRDYAHFHLGKVLVRWGKDDHQATFHLKRALQSKGIHPTHRNDIHYQLAVVNLKNKEQSLEEAVRRGLPAETVERAQSNVQRAQNELLRRTRDTRKADGYYTYIISLRKKGLDSMSQKELESLLSAYHFAITQYGNRRRLPPAQLLAELHSERADVAKRINTMHHVNNGAAVPPLPVREASLFPYDDMPEETQSILLVDLVAQDEATAAELRKSAAAAGATQPVTKTANGGAGRK